MRSLLLSAVLGLAGLGWFLGPAASQAEARVFWWGSGYYPTYSYPSFYSYSYGYPYSAGYYAPSYTASYPVYSYYTGAFPVYSRPFYSSYYYSTPYYSSAYYATPSYSTYYAAPYYSYYPYYR